MARRVRIDWNQQGFRDLMRDPALVEGRGERIADACNADSSWGGYYSAVSVSDIRARARVWSIGGNGEARKQRLIRNLDAGK